MLLNCDMETIELVMPSVTIKYYLKKIPNLMSIVNLSDNKDSIIEYFNEEKSYIQYFDRYKISWGSSSSLWRFKHPQALTTNDLIPIVQFSP